MRNQTDSPLLRLPRELRDEIYKYAIGGNEITVCHPDAYYRRFIVRAGAYNEGSANMGKWKELFDVSLACRQLNAETKDLPYKLSVWANHLGREFGDFLSQFKQSKKQAITTISFGFPSHQPSFVIDWEELRTLPKELGECTGLKTVISRITLGAGRKRMVKEFAEARGLKLVYDTVVFDAYHVDFEDNYWGEVDLENIDDDEGMYYEDD
jgi:hypothetical protein